MASESKCSQHVACVETKEMAVGDRFVYAGNRTLVVIPNGPRARTVIEVYDADDLSASPTKVDLRSPDYEVGMITQIHSIGGGVLYTIGYDLQVKLVGEWSIRNDRSVHLNKVFPVTLFTSVDDMRAIKEGQVIVSGGGTIATVNMDALAVGWTKSFGVGSLELIVDSHDEHFDFGVVCDRTVALFSFNKPEAIGCLSSDGRIYCAAFVKGAGLLIGYRSRIVLYAITVDGSSTKTDQKPSVRIEKRLELDYIQLSYKCTTTMRGTVPNFVVSESKHIRMFTVNSTSFNCAGNLVGHTELIRSIQAGEHDELFSSDESGVLKRWDLSKCHTTSQLVLHHDHRPACGAIVVDGSAYYVTQGGHVCCLDNASVQVLMRVPVGRVKGFCAAGSAFLLIYIDGNDFRGLVTKKLDQNLKALSFKQGWFDGLTAITTVSDWNIVVCYEDKSIKVLSCQPVYRMIGSGSASSLTEVFCCRLQVGPIQELRHVTPDCVYCPHAMELVMTITRGEFSVRYNDRTGRQCLVLDSSGTITSVSDTTLTAGRSAVVLGPGSVAMFNDHSINIVTYTDGSWIVTGTVEDFYSIVSVTALTKTVLVVTCKYSGVHLYDIMSEKVISIEEITSD